MYIYDISRTFSENSDYNKISKNIKIILNLNLKRISKTL